MRLHYFDNGKAVASVLGFFYHVGLIFSVSWHINVSPEDYNGGIQILTEILNLFRMPLFMFVAGYFALYSVKKYDFRSFSKSKFFRLVIPLISSLYTLVFIQYIYSNVVYEGSQSISEVAQSLLPWTGDFSLSHLWFLYIVIIYSFMLYLLVKNTSFSEGTRYKINSLISRVGTAKWDLFFVAASIMFSLFFIGVSKVFPDHGLLTFNYFGIFITYFLMGVLCFSFWDKFKHVFFDISYKRLFFALAISLTFFIMDQLFSTKDSLIFVVASHSTNMVAKYFSLIVVLFALYKFMNKTNKVLRYLADSSYSVYLLHQPVIVVVAYYYLSVFESPSLVSYMTILLISILVTYTLDFIVIKNTVIGRFLYTGTLPKGSYKNEAKNTSPTK